MAMRYTRFPLVFGCGSMVRCCQKRWLRLGFKKWLILSVGSWQNAGFCRSDSRSRWVAQHSVLHKRWLALVVKCGRFCRWGLDKKQDFVGRHQEVGWHSSRCCKIVGNTRVGSGQKAGFCRSDSRSRVAQHSVLQKRWLALVAKCGRFCQLGLDKKQDFVGWNQEVGCYVLGAAKRMLRLGFKKWPILSVGSGQRAVFCRSDSRSRVAQHSVPRKRGLRSGSEKWPILTVGSRQKAGFCRTEINKSGVMFSVLPKRMLRLVFKKWPILSVESRQKSGFCRWESRSRVA